MTLVRQISQQDVMFIAGETETLYQHVGLLMVLDPAETPEFDFAFFRQQCIERLQLIPHFQWKLHQLGFPRYVSTWVKPKYYKNPVMAWALDRTALELMGLANHTPLEEGFAQLVAHWKATLQE